MQRIGVISDTHGFLDPRVHDVFTGVDRIVHAGDIGIGILEELELIAPVRAVLGNNDHWDFDLPVAIRLEVEGVTFQVAHMARHILPPPASVTIHGHTHIAEVIRTREGLLVNPGSASRPRGGRGPSVALVEVAEGMVKNARIVGLDSIGTESTSSP